MTLPAELAAKILRLAHAEKWPVGTIAQQCHVHPDSVQRVLDQAAGRVAVARPRPTLLSSYLAFIDDTLAHYPTVPASRLYDMVRARGYLGSARTVRLAVAERRPRRREVYLRVETLPGEQAQIDWAYVATLTFDGTKRKLWLCVVVLAHSRAMWGEFVLDLTAASLRRSLLRAALAFDGVPRVWLFDNPKTVVVERVGAVARFHPALVEVCAALRVEPRVCAVRRPQDKGKVERAIRYVRDRFLAAHEIHDVAQGNAELRQFIAGIAHQRPHPTQPTHTVGEVAAAEAAYLLPLPTVMPPLMTPLPVRADRQAFVRFDGNRYSVPATSADRTLLLLADDVSLRIVDGDRTVAVHDRSWRRHAVIEVPAHRATLVAAKRRAGEAKGRDRLFAVAPQMQTLVAAWGLDGHRLGFRVTRAVLLLNQYGDALFAAAVADLHARGLHDIATLTIACERLRKQRGRAVALPLTFAADFVDDDVVPHNLETYDDPT